MAFANVCGNELPGPSREQIGYIYVGRLDAFLLIANRQTLTALNLVLLFVKPINQTG